jgi:hypothetical protein
MPDRIITVGYKELTQLAESVAAGPELKSCVEDCAQPFEEEIARYLETAPSYSAVGRVVGDVLDPDAKVVLFPGVKTDGRYIWPAELSYYVRRYHVRVPQSFVDRMASLDWRPPSESEIDWQAIVQFDQHQQ